MLSSRSTGLSIIGTAATLRDTLEVGGRADIWVVVAESEVLVT